MKLTESQKQTLLTRHLPILLGSVNDISVPIAPTQFIEMSSLWSASRPELDNKSLWGWAEGTEENDRLPLVDRGGLDSTIFPQDIISYSQEADELWLDCGGWTGGDGVADWVDNREPNIAHLGTLFGQDSPPVVSAEVCDENTWLGIPSRVTERSLGISNIELSQILNNVILINYQMLFAGHEQNIKETFPDGNLYSAGNFEGDWICFSLLLSASTAHSNLTEFQPRFALFERRFRNQSASFGENREVRRYASVPWNETPKLGSYPIVLVATGTHNLYPANTVTTSGHVKPQSASFGYGDNVTDDVNRWVDDFSNVGKAVNAAVLGVTLAKMTAGSAVAGPFGAMAGLIAGLIEATPIRKAVTTVLEVPELEIDPETGMPPEGELKDPRDQLEATYLVHTSEAINVQQIVDQLTFDATIDRVLQWSGRSYEPVNRESEYYWPTYGGDNSEGYVGRWGVRCELDPFNRRAGGILPDYRIEVLRNVLHLIVRR